MTSFLLPHSSSFFYSQLFDQSSYFPFIRFLSFILILSHPFFLHNHFPVSHTSSITFFLPPNSSSFLSHILYHLLSSTHHLLFLQPFFQLIPSSTTFICLSSSAYLSLISCCYKLMIPLGVTWDQLYCYDPTVYS